MFDVGTWDSQSLMNDTILLGPFISPLNRPTADHTPSNPIVIVLRHNSCYLWYPVETQEEEEEEEAQEGQEEKSQQKPGKRQRQRQRE